MSTIRTNAIIDAAGGNTATINGAYIRPGVLDPENRIINGAFDFWQRGTSFTVNQYGADRWINESVGGTVTMSRQSFATGEVFGSNNPSFFLRQTVSGQSAASHYGLIYQPIESVRSYAGQTITALGWARRSSGSGNMAVALDQVFGTGGSFSPAVNGAGQTVPLTGSWAPFAVTFSVPSITGKTLGTNGNDRLLLIFWTSAGSDFNARSNSLGLQTIGVDLWGIHIKVGTHTTAAVDLYKQPELGPELVRCQRYYEKSYDLATNPATATTANAVLAYFPITVASGNIMPIFFATQKRASPAVVIYSPASGASAAIRDVGAGVDRTAAISAVGTRAVFVTSSAATNNNQHSAHFTADAEL